MSTHSPVFLSGIRPLAVGPTLKQERIARWLEQGLLAIDGETPEARRAIAFFKRLDRGGAIAERAVCVADYLTSVHSQWQLFRPDGKLPWFSPSLERRMELFQEVADAAADAAFPLGDPAPPAMLLVTCTGYQSPNALQRLVAKRGWGNDCHLLQLGHMGCYAAIPATRMASLNARDKGRCSVLHVELCSLHLDLETTDLEQMVVHHLFADGAVRYDLDLVSPAGRPHFEVVDTFECLIPGTDGAMTWQLGSQGFRMTLAKDVPRMISDAVPSVVGKALGKHGIYRNDINRWAIHPGGPRVIGDLAKSLEISEPRTVAHSWKVLKERGNMSSATLPHIWCSLLEDPDVNPGELIVSLAFGPGLTVTGNILRKGA